jgi:pilus assembly protein CpaF
MTTIHSNSPRDALSRLETMVLMAGLDLPSRAVREQITSALNLIVHVRRYEDGVRRIESVSELTGMEGNTPLLQEIFAFRRRGRQGRHVIGDFIATGIVPHFIEDLRQRGIEVQLEWFQKRGADV